MPEAAADETEDIQQEDTEAVETLDETAEEADPFSTGEEDFTEGDEVAEAFSDSDQLTGEYQYVYAGLTWGEYWAAEGVYAAGDTSSSEEKDYTIATWKSFAGELQEAEKELQKVTVTLDKTAAAVYTGKTTTLKATTNDSDAIVTFKSGNTKVATVSSKGVVKGVKAGTAVITAKVGNATATCKVTVKASTIKFEKASVTIYKGKTATVKATATPSATVKYTSSNTKVATVNSKTGVVKGIKAGTVTITAKAGALKTTCKVVVKNPAFSLVKSSATIKKGKTTTIRSKAAPAGKVTYTSSNKKVAAVNSKGVVKGIKKGKATITVKCNGITKKFVVTVK